MKPGRILAVAPLCFVLFDGGVEAAPKHVSPVTTAAQSGHSVVSRSAVYAALSGHWTGSLEYRDFQTDKRVTLPTVLEITAVESQSAVQFAYTYDDGPGKIVREKATIRIPDPGNRYIVKDEDGSESVYTIASAKGFSGTGSGKLILAGTGTDNNKPVEVRTTLEVTEKSLVILRETKLAGEDFKFRHQYSFARATSEKPAQ